jgi:stage V sporulation protein R
MKKRKEWDTKAMLGKQKVFEVCKNYDDPMLIAEFFTEDFCRKMEFFTWKHYPNGDTKLETIDYPKIKAMLMKRFTNRGLPDIRLVEPNHRGRGQLLLQDFSASGTLYDPYLRETMTSLRALWGNDVLVATKNKDGSEIVYHCHGSEAEKGVTVKSREKYEKGE